MKLCPGCNKEMIYDGKIVFNGLLKCHWDCSDIVRQKMGDQNADDLIQYRINERLLQDGIDRNHRLFNTL